MGPERDKQRVQGAARLPDLLSEPTRHLPVERLSVSKYCLDPLAGEAMKEEPARELIVRKTDQDDHYEVISGYSALEAARNKAVKKAACKVVDVDDKRALELSYLAIQRGRTLDPVTRAHLLKHMLEAAQDGIRFYEGITELAEAVGDRRQAIGDALVVLKLVPDVLAMVRTGAIGYPAAVAIAYAIKDPEHQRFIAEEIQGLPKRKQKEMIDLLKGSPQLLAQSQGAEALRTAIKDILVDFTPEQRKRLSDLYTRARLSPKTIDWASMTTAKYALEVAAVRRFLALQTLADTDREERKALPDAVSSAPLKSLATIRKELESLREVHGNITLGGEKSGLQFLSDELEDAGWEPEDIEAFRAAFLFLAHAQASRDTEP